MRNAFALKLSARPVGLNEAGCGGEGVETPAEILIQLCSSPASTYSQWTMPGSSRSILQEK